MSSDSQVDQFFSEAQETMRLKFRGWVRDLPHQGEKGGIRERRVSGFLATVLPEKYGIGTGHVISVSETEQGAISHQTDIVIYDALNGVRIPIDDHYSLFPCECVYAAIEVKSKLNASDGKAGPAGTIYECLESTTRLKMLNRARHSLPPIHSIVFSYTTAWKESPEQHLKEHFENLGEKYNKRLPEMVCVLEPGFVLGVSGPTGYNADGKFTHVLEKNPLLYFVADLIHRLSETKVSTPNLWYDYLNWKSGDVMAKVWKEP